MGQDKDNLTPRLADFTLSLRYEDLPPLVVERAKQLFLDFLGVACGGKACAVSSGPVLASVQALRAGQPGPSTVIGEGERFPAHYAALLNGTFAHSMDFDDTDWETTVHPGAPVFSTLLALGEAAHVSGRDLLTGAVAGYEVCRRLVRVYKDALIKRGFHPTATSGIFAATAAAARMLGLPREMLLNAWGINLSQVAGTMQWLENGAWTKRVQIGLVAHNAIVALPMAQHGVLGAARPFEGRFGYFFSYVDPSCDLSAALEGLGEGGFEILRIGVKPYPCNRYSNSVIEGVLSLVQEHTLTPANVQEIELGLGRHALTVAGQPEEVKKAPRNIVDGQFSLHFAAAGALLDRGFTWETYRHLEDPQARALMARTRTVEVQGLGLGARVAITTTGKERLVKEVRVPKGEPEHFLTWKEHLTKVRPMALQVLPRERVEPMVEMVARLEQVPDMALFTPHLRP